MYASRLVPLTPCLQIIEHRSALNILVTSSSSQLNVLYECLLRLSEQRNAGSITGVAREFPAAVFCCYTTEIVNSRQWCSDGQQAYPEGTHHSRRSVSRRCTRKAQHVRRYICPRLNLHKPIRSDVCLRRSSRTCSGTHQRAHSCTCPAVVRLCMLCSACARVK